MRRDAGVNNEAKRTIAMRCADSIVVVHGLNSRGVHNQQRAEDPKDKTSGIPRAEWRLRPGHNDVWLKPVRGLTGNSSRRGTRTR